MPALTLNGIEIPLAQAKAPQLSLERAGTKERGHNGEHGGAYRNTDRVWRCTTPALPRATARALRGLVAGTGHHWPCEPGNTKSDRRLVGVNEAGLNSGGPGSLLNHGSFIFADGGTGNIAWVVGAATEWTILASCYLSKPGENHVWRRIIRRSDGAKWQASQTSSAAVRDDAFDMRTLFYDLSSQAVFLRSKEYQYDAWGGGGSLWSAGRNVVVGQVIRGTDHAGFPTANAWAYECAVAGVTGASAPAFTNTTGSTFTDNTVTWRAIGERFGYAGDIAWVPWAMPDAWVQQAWSFHKARPWSALPQLLAAGELVGSATATATVLGVVDGVEPVVTAAGVYDAVSFTLREV